MFCTAMSFVLTFLVSIQGPVTFSLTCDMSVETPRKTIEVLEGESETLECEYNADESCIHQYVEWCIMESGIYCESIIHIADSQVYWFKDFEDFYSYDGINLIIDEAQTKHEGEYWCSVFSAERTETDTLNVYVLVQFAPIDISISIDESPVIKGNEVLLTCTADGIPSPTYDWTQNGVELSDRNKYQINEDGSELTILNITKHEREYYNCTATNQKGIDATAVFIDVYYEPQTGWPLCELHVETNQNYMAEGDFAELTCKATGGNPPPYLEWYNNSQALPECTSTTDDNDVVTETVSCWTLTLYDNGKMYECKGNHAATEETPNCFTEVFDVKFPPSEPEGCTTSLTGYSSPVVEGDGLVLTCTSCSGNPIPIIEWFEDENRIKSGLGDIYNSPGIYHGEISVQDLTLHLTYRNHGQRLRCECFNEEFKMEKDSAVSDEIILNVYYAPFVVNEVNNQRLVVLLTEKGDLLCEINSNPEVEITWFDNNNETICNGTGKFLVRKTTADTITTGVLTIFNISESDLGDYRCHAINDIDEVIFTIHLSAKSSPDPATELQVIDRREANLTVQWKVGNDGGSKQVFHLEYIKQNMVTMSLVPEYCDQYGKTTNVTTKTYDTITDLTPMTSYSIVVVSSNEIGCTRSHPVVDSTLPRTPVEDEDIKFNQYTGELLIIAQVGLCIKIDKRKSDDEWITITFHTANGSCDGSVAYTVEGPALLRIYFCNDDYTDCGDPYETEFHVKGKSNTGAIIGISLTTVVLLATLCVGIIVHVRRRNSKDTEDNVGPVYENPQILAFDEYMDIVTPKDKPGTGVDNEGAYAELRQTKTEYMGLGFTNRKQGMHESNDDIETTDEVIILRNISECDK